jgi:hypothetical protein
MAEENQIDDLLFQMEQVQITEDEHCLFRAFAKSIHGKELCYQRYREKAAESIENYDLLHHVNDEEKKEYLARLRDDAWGGPNEINALALYLRRQVKVFHEVERENREQAFILHEYPNVHGQEALNLVEEGNAIIFLSFHPIDNVDPNIAGHYDLLVKKRNDEPTLAEVTEKLRQQLETLESDRLRVSEEDFSKKFHTSFLKRDIMDARSLGCVLPTLDLISDIARRRNWYRNEEALRAINDVFTVLSNCVEVSGDPEKNIFCMNPVIMLVHIVAYIVYYPVMMILMVLLILGRVQPWFTLITGFAGAAVSAISMKSDNLDTLSQILGIITGILAAAKGITLEQDPLFKKAQDLTVDVLRSSVGNISKEAVFQKFLDCTSFQDFHLTIEIKKADIEMVQTARIFFALVIDCSLVEIQSNFSEIHRMHMKSKLIEGALLDPHNYKTLERLTSEDLESEFHFRREDVVEIKEYYKNIITVRSFCSFLRKLNETALHFPLVDPNAQANANEGGAQANANEGVALLRVPHAGYDAVHEEAQLA